MTTLIKEQTPLQKTKGAVRNLTMQFMKRRQGAFSNESTAQESHQQIMFESDIGSRFKPLKSNFLMALSSSGNNQMFNNGGGSYSGVNSPQETEKLTGDNVKLLPYQNKVMSTKASSKDDSGEIEYGKRFLPPLWVDIQEDIERHIEEVTHKMADLKRLQQRRLKVNFVDDDDDDSSKSLQRSIDNLTSDITDLVRASESKLRELMKCRSDDKFDEQIRTNIQITLAQRLKDITFKLRKREKKHYLKVQELDDEPSGFKSKKDRDSFLNDGEGYMQTQNELTEEVVELDQTHRLRNKEIKTLVSTINDLAVLFKELSILVVEQGTILDRIDYNIECAHKDTQKAVEHIENTVKIEKSMRSKGMLGCLLTGIAICLIILIIKHT